MKKKIRDVILSSEGALTSFFQKLPELFILLLIPVALFIYIFVRPQMTSKKSSVIENNKMNNEESVDDNLRALMGDAQKDVIGGTDSARLESISTPSAITKRLPNLDLIGPWTCENSDASGNIMKLYIHSKSLKFISQSAKSTEQFLVKDGCLYTWVDNGMGKKQCSGIADAIAVAELATQSGLVDISSVLDQMSGDQTTGMKSLLSSCQKVSVSPSIFLIPQGIKWVEDNTLLEGVR